MSANAIALSEVPARPLTLRLHEWVTTVDHKRLGVLYVVYALIFLALGGIEATLRTQQGMFAVSPSDAFAIGWPVYRFR
jgi:heme/copper-type cytochrome/quinol oxidase subunit 1